MSEQIEKLKGFIPRSRSNAINRCYYTPESASHVVDVFDEMIKTGEDKNVMSDKIGLKPTSLYLKFQDGLKWLCENHPTRQEVYSLFRMRVKITKTDWGLRIYFKNNIANTIMKNTLTKESLTWKDRFDEWFKTAQQYDIFEEENVIVTDTQKEYVINVMSGLNSPTAQVQITSNTVKVMR